MSAPHITGPLRTWYDLHEALRTEISRIVDAGKAIDANDAAAVEELAERFGFFEGELRTHSEVEDGIMFPAIRAAGGKIDDSLTEDHHREQQLVYDTASALLEAKSLHDASAVPTAVDALGRLRDALIPHFEAEEDHVLPQLPDLFTDPEQAKLLQTIITSLPPDPRLQPWVAASLTPEHRDARLRNMAASLPHEALVGVMRQIHDGVPADVWSDIEKRTPELAELVTG